MSKEELKLECVKLAVALNVGPVVGVASEIYAFVAGSPTEREECDDSSNQ